MKATDAVARELGSRTVKKAREMMAKVFKGDPDFRRGYVDNVAMLLHDRYGIRDYKTRNQAADDILRLIFE